jgi:hypothetical protein
LRGKVAYLASVDPKHGEQFGSLLGESFGQALRLWLRRLYESLSCF